MAPACNFPQSLSLHKIMFQQPPAGILSLLGEEPGLVPETLSPSTSRRPGDSPPSGGHRSVRTGAGGAAGGADKVRDYKGRCSTSLSSLGAQRAADHAPARSPSLSDSPDSAAPAAPAGTRASAPTADAAAAAAAPGDLVAAVGRRGVPGRAAPTRPPGAIGHPPRGRARSLVPGVEDALRGPEGQAPGTAELARRRARPRPRCANPQPRT